MGCTALLGIRRGWTHVAGAHTYLAALGIEGSRRSTRGGIRSMKACPIGRRSSRSRRRAAAAAAPPHKRTTWRRDRRCLDWILLQEGVDAAPSSPSATGAASIWLRPVCVGSGWDRAHAFESRGFWRAGSIAKDAVGPRCSHSLNRTRPISIIHGFCRRTRDLGYSRVAACIPAHHRCIAGIGCPANPRPRTHNLLLLRIPHTGSINQPRDADAHALLATRGARLCGAEGAPAR